jgi:Uma2 family endonuclease
MGQSGPEHVERKVDDVTTAILHHEGPWTEEDYFALGETEERFELWDGELVVSPSASLPHQELSWQLSSVFRPPARKVGLRVFEAVNVRLQTGRIPVPDLVIADTAVEGNVIDAPRVRLICEIVSPSNATTDWVRKRNAFAKAGIPWYLIVDPEPISSLTLHLLRLQVGHYVEHAVAKVGETMRFTEPFVLDLDVAELLDW